MIKGSMGISFLRVLQSFHREAFPVKASRPHVIDMDPYLLTEIGPAYIASLEI